MLRMDKVTGEWRKLHNEELIDLYCSPNIVRVIEWRRMIWAGHVESKGERRGVHLRERSLEVPDVDGRIILRWIFRTWDVRVRSGSSWLRIGTGGGHL